MTQSLFDALTSGISTIENQSAIQSILESQTGAENASAQVDDEDLFQCGKCKKQFTSLPMFVNHKQGRCSLNLPRQTFQPSVLQGLNTGTLNGAVAQTIQKSPLTQTTLPSFTTVSQSTLNQLAPSVVLGEDQILTYSDLGTAVQNGIIQGSTLHLTGNTVQAAGPFLSQVAQLAPRPANSNVTIISPVQSTTTLAPSNGTTLTNPVSINNLQSLVQPTQQITLATPLPEIKPAGSNVVKPNIIKPGRKPGQGTVGGGGLDESDSSPRRRPRIGAAVGNDMGKKKLSCNYCGKEFTKNFDLQQHIRSHTGERPFQCVVCGRAFAQKSNVKKHMATHKVWPTGPGSTLPDQPPALLVPVDDCQKAEVTITTQALPEQPVQEQAPVQNDVEIITDKPEKQQITEETTQNYKVKVIIDNSYLCQYCPEKFKSYYQLKSHMVKHKNVQVYKCVVKNCGSVFKDLDAYLEHTTSHSDELTYRCHLCSKVFSSLYDLGVHQYSHSMYQHPSNKSGPRYFQCNKCLNKYSTPEALEHHINTTDHKFPCPHCQKNFTSERFLRRHLVFHGTEGQFECTVCQKTFKTEHYLKNHALIHTGEKPFECEICGAKFNRKDKLKRHNLIHDKRVRVKCPFKSVSGCDKEFNRPDKLKAHIITHSGIKPFACQICGKEFGRRPHLKEHEKAHREEYPYKCTKCNRGFFRPKLFKEHKCEDANGQIIRKRVFQPRRMKRKPGRPRKIVRKQGVEGNAIIINSTKKGGSERIVVQTAPAGHKIKKKQTVKISTPESAVVQETDSSAGNICETVMSDKTEPISTVVLPEENMEIAKLASTVSIPDTNVIDTAQELGTKGKKAKPECYVKAPPASMVPVSVVERYVTVHLTSTGQGDLSEMHAQLIPSGDFAGQLQFSTALQNGQIQISPPSSGTTYHPLHIIEGQPVTLTVSQQDHLNALGVNENDVIDIPVDIVTVSDDRGLVCSHEVTNTGDSGEQTYTIGDYGPEGDVVLQGSENLINGSVEILGHDQEAMVNLENE